MKVAVLLPNEIDKDVQPAYSIYIIKSFPIKSNRILSSQLHFCPSSGITKLMCMVSLVLNIFPELSVCTIPLAQ